MNITIRCYTICPPFEQFYPISFDVTGTPPELTAGQSYTEIGMNNFVTIDGISATDVDPCDDISYSILSGPGAIDSETGVYTWSPTDTDIGEHWVVVEASDGGQTDVDSLYLNVVADSDMYGNVTCEGGVNIADAVYLVSYIFRGGDCPPIMNWADANGDCVANIGDAVYLIQYIFNGGPAPQAGCVN